MKHWAIRGGGLVIILEVERSCDAQVDLSGTGVNRRSHQTLHNQHLVSVLDHLVPTIWSWHRRCPCFGLVERVTGQHIMVVR
jgi:hypothetical protein